MWEMWSVKDGLILHPIFLETNLNKIKHHFSGNKKAWARRRINELTILTANYNFTENLASQRPKLSLFSSLLLTPRPQKNRRGKAQRFLGKAILRMYFIFLSTQSLFRSNSKSAWLWRREHAVGKTEKEITFRNDFCFYSIFFSNLRSP